MDKAVWKSYTWMAWFLRENHNRRWQRGRSCGMTGIQTLFGVVKDQQVSGGNMSILQDHMCSCSVRNVIWTWTWFTLVTELCILRVAVPAHTCMVAWACSRWSPKNMVYEHRIRRNQELNHKILDTAICVSQGSIVGIVTSYRLHGQGFKSWQGQEIFLFLKPVHIGSGLPSVLFNRYQVRGESGWVMRITIHLQHLQDMVWTLTACLCKMCEWTWCSSDLTHSMVTEVRMSIQTSGGQFGHLFISTVPELFKCQW